MTQTRRGFLGHVLRGRVAGTAALAATSWTEGFPRSFWPIELLLSSALLGGVRFGIRAADTTVGWRNVRRPTSSCGSGRPLRSSTAGVPMAPAAPVTTATLLANFFFSWSVN